MGFMGIWKIGDGSHELMERVSSDRISVITLKRFKKYYIRYPSLRLPNKCDYLPIKMIQFFKTNIIRKTLILLFALYTL